MPETSKQPFSVKGAKYPARRKCHLSTHLWPAPAALKLGPGDTTLRTSTT